MIRIGEIEREIAGLEAIGVEVPEVFFKQLIEAQIDLADLMDGP